MRIAIDARMINPDTMHGIARYVYHLLLGIRDLKVSHEVYILVNRASPLTSMTWPNNMHCVEVSADWISLREQIVIPRILRELKIDLFHAPSFVAPFFVPCRMVMTIHDLNHMVLPQFYTPFHQFYYQVIVRNSIKRSQYILTVSQFSKQEIIRTLGLEAEKIVVTYNGVSENYRPVTDIKYLKYVKEMYGLPDKFILCVSNNKPHKNIHQLVRAFCYSNLSIPLVLACPVDFNLIRIAENYGKKHLLYFSKFIEETHLPAFYSMTELFVFPSTYEGFGLPPLEALACGAAVVVAKSSSLPEVVGENAIFANPYDYKSIAEALECGINDTALRTSLQSHGQQYAQKFSWENMSIKTLEIYERCESSLEHPQTKVPVSCVSE